MHKLGIFMNFWEKQWGADHVKYLKKARDIGFDILEFQAQPLLEMSNERLLEIKKASEEYGIEMTYSLGLDPAYDLASVDPAIRAKGIVYLTEILKKIAFLDGKILSGVNYAGWGIPKDEPIDKAALTANSVESVKKLAHVAEDLGITYAVEVVNRFEGVVLNTAAQAVDYVKAVDCKNVGILLDTYHMNIEEPSFRDAILAAGPYLVGMHTGENNRTIPGRGHLPWDEIFGALRDVNFTGRIVSEPFVMAGGEVGRAICTWADLQPDTSEAALDASARELVAFERSMLTKYFG